MSTPEERGKRKGGVNSTVIFSGGEERQRGRGEMQGGRKSSSPCFKGGGGYKRFEDFFLCGKERRKIQILAKEQRSRTLKGRIDHFVESGGEEMSHSPQQKKKKRGMGEKSRKEEGKKERQLL